MRVLVFGDSITQGYWAVNRGWVERVKHYYDEIAFSDLKNDTQPGIMNLGISGDTSYNILKRIRNETISRTWQEDKQRPVIVLQVGINDSCIFNGERMTELADYKDNLQKIVVEARGVSSKIILVGFTSCDEVQTQPVYWGDYKWDNSSMEQYESIMGEVAEDQKLPFIPVFREFNKRVQAGGDLLPDGLHPNDAGHKLIYQIVMPKLREMLK